MYQSSPEKQSIGKRFYIYQDIYIYIYQEIYYKELAHMIMETDKSQNMQGE